MKDSKQMDFFQSISSQEDTLANLSPLQVEKKVKKIQDTSGQSILDLSKNSDQLGLLEKMLVDTLNSVSTPYSRTWRVKVTPQGRLVFQLRASVPTTKEKESGLWATPQTMDGTRANQIRHPSQLSDKAKKGGCSNLREQVMWRTPDNMKGGSNLPGIKKALDEGHLKRPSGQQIQIRLQDQVKEKRLWPTPTLSHALRGNHEEPIEKYQNRVKDYEEGRAKGKPGKSLGVAVRISPKKWSTPTTQDAKNNGNPSQMKRNTKPLNAEVGGTLNPTWVEWLMGYPSGWTDLNH